MLPDLHTQRKRWGLFERSAPSRPESHRLSEARLARPVRSDQFGQNLVEGCFRHNAGGSFYFAFGVDKHPGRLARNAEVGVERIIEIGQVHEGELVLGDKALEGLVIA